MFIFVFLLENLNRDIEHSIEMPSFFEFRSLNLLESF